MGGSWVDYHMLPSLFYSLKRLRRAEVSDVKIPYFGFRCEKTFIFSGCMRPDFGLHFRRGHSP